MAEQTDDQRAAADVMTELHECAEGANPYGGMAARALALIQNRDDELDRLRAELAETRAVHGYQLDEIRRVQAAGDALAAAIAWYGAPHERFWEADDQWDPFADHDTADCERPEDLDGAHLGSGARRPHDVPTATDGPSVVVDRMMRRLSSPDLPAVGQHADLVRSLQGRDGLADEPCVCRTDFTCMATEHTSPADDTAAPADAPDTESDRIEALAQFFTDLAAKLDDAGRAGADHVDCGRVSVVSARALLVAALGYSPPGDDPWAVDDTAAPDMPAIVAGVERSYVEALNAILAAPGGSDDVDRWRGQAEAYRTVAEQLRRDHGMPRVEYGSGEWRRTHGVQAGGSR